MAEASAREVVLVTGFPLLIARLVTEELLARAPHRVVRLLVRTKFVPEAQAYVRASRFGNRIELLEGDVAAIDLGLSGQEFNALAAELDYIQHLAQVSYEGADRKVTYALNVQGAREVLELAKAS